MVEPQLIFFTVIARPGPYCNAETNAGGFALYLADGSSSNPSYGGNLRTSDATYHAAWTPWVQYIAQIIAANEYAKGGPVVLTQVENELQETVHVGNNTLVCITHHSLIIEI